MTGIDRQHYVEEYRKYVTFIKSQFPPAEAMAMAIGGQDFDAVGDMHAGLLTHFGLKEGDSLVDVGCGSGRLAAALTRTFGNGIDYVGLDVVEDLLAWGRTVADPSYAFQMNVDLSIPRESDTTDFIVFFSVVTHLLHEESFLYLKDAARVIKPGGAIVVTFLESERHWSIFERFVEVYQHPEVVEPLVMFIERPMLETWASKLGLEIEQVIGFDPPDQTVAVLRKPLAPH